MQKKLEEVEHPPPRLCHPPLPPVYSKIHFFPYIYIYEIPSTFIFLIKQHVYRPPRPRGLVLLSNQSCPRPARALRVTIPARLALPSMYRYPQRTQGALGATHSEWGRLSYLLLQVLLPPKTAHLYSQLLQHEISELERGRRADWDRIVAIRHLKDRMIRKCQRLSRMTHTGTIPAAFRIVHAPPDFRLKEMERWLRDQEPRGKSSKEARRQPSVETINTQSQTSHPPYAHAQPSSRPPRPPRAHTSSASAQRASSSRVPATLKRSGSGSTRSSSYVGSRASTDSLRQGLSAPLSSMHPFLSPVAEEQPESPPPVGVLPIPFGDPPQHGGEDSAFASPAAAREAVVSPDPLPHLYRPPSLHAPMAEMATAMMAGQPAPLMVPPLPQITIEPHGESMPLGMPEPVLDPGQPLAGQSRPLLRRRSSLRQGRSSANGTPKVVSWAMDRDWADHLTKFDHVIYAAEFASSSFIPSG